LDTARILAHSLYRLIEAIVQREIPLRFLAFPRFCTDLEYLRRALVPVLPHDLDAARFVNRIGPLVERHKIRVGEEIDEARREVIDEDPEPTYPKISTLYEASLKREVKRLLAELSVARTQLAKVTEQLDAMAAGRQQLQELLANSRAASFERCERLDQELRERATQISQLQVNLKKMQGELFEKAKDSKQLRQQIDSIHTSICWRVTWPIRWFHKQVAWARRRVPRCRSAESAGQIEGHFVRRSKKLF
jgi:hypothetical protein